MTTHPGVSSSKSRRFLSISRPFLLYISSDCTIIRFISCIICIFAFLTFCFSALKHFDIIRQTSDDMPIFSFCPAPSLSSFRHIASRLFFHIEKGFFRSPLLVQFLLLFFLLRHSRASMGRYACLWTTERYAGRMMRPPVQTSSILCAHQPAMRAIANSGV